MKKTILPFLLTLLLGTSNTYAYDCCNNDNAFYAKIFSGANFLENTSIDENKSSYQAGYVVAGSLGYSWCYGLRFEAEYAYRRNEIKKIHFFIDETSKRGHYQSSSYMGNFLWDLPLASWGCAFQNIQPFIGAGIGYDCQQMHSTNSRISFSQKWERFSWQVMTGLSYPIYRNTIVSLEYKFHQSGHFDNHAVGVGVAYKFAQF